MFGSMLTMPLAEKKFCESKLKHRVEVVGKRLKRRNQRELRCMLVYELDTRQRLELLDRMHGRLNKLRRKSEWKELELQARNRKPMDTYTEDIPEALP